MSITVRALQTDEWELFRDLRHRSLAGSPDAFRSTHRDTLLVPDDEWKDIVASTTASPRGLLLAAERDGDAVGTNLRQDRRR